MHHGVVNFLVHGADDAILSENNTISPHIGASTEVAVVTVVSPSQDQHSSSAVISNSAPRILIGNPVCQCITPRPHRISTWPRKRNILSLVRLLRSVISILNICHFTPFIHSNRKIMDKLKLIAWHFFRAVNS